MDADIEDLRLEAHRTAALTGRLVVSADDRLALGGMEVALAPRDRLPVGRILARTRPDGTFTIPRVAPGAYGVYPGRLPEQVAVESFTFAGEVLRGNELEVPEMMNGELHIELSGRAGSIVGRVSDTSGKPAAAVYVLSLPDEPRFDDEAYITVTDQFGTFKQPSLRPGRYRVYSWTVLDPRRFSRAGAAAYASRARDVVVKRGEQANVEVTLINE